MSTPATAKPTETPKPPAQPAVKPPAQTQAPGPSATEETPPAEESSSGCCSAKNIRRALLATGVVVLAVAIPLISARLCKSDDEEEEEEPQKETKLTASAVLDKLVGWVREGTKQKDDQGDDKPVDDVDANADDIAEIASVVDFAKTQSL